MNKKKRIGLFAIAVLVVLAILLYQYAYQDHRDIANEEAVMVISANELKELFQNDKGSEALNKTVIVSGQITEKEDSTLTLDDAVHCKLSIKADSLEVGTAVTAKGRCIGYDDLFELVKLDQTTLE